MTSIAMIVGSLRAESINRQLAVAITRLAPREVEFTWPDLSALPLYNQDDDPNPPEAAVALKQAIRDADGVIFVSPEYNRSISGMLKNALDHASRPYGKSAWAGKPAAVIGITAGMSGTAMAQQHLRNVLAALDMPTLAHPEAFLRLREDTFTADDGLGETSRPFVQKWLDTYLAFLARNIG